MESLVVKFGGTSIGNPERVRLAANSVAREVNKGKKVVVVVSAMGSTTDELISLFNESVKDRSPSFEDYAEFVSMGERTSARLFASTLNAVGVKSTFVDPLMDNWPIITDDNYPKANVIKSTTTQMVKKCILPLWEDGVTPVIGGFIGKSMKGNITLLGRGGSDVTAFVIGEALKVDEIIIVTDVEGVLSADPRRLSSEVSVLEDITAEEMQILAENGAKVLHPDAVKYKPPNIKAKIIHYKYGDLSVRGTQIKGSIQEQVALLNGRLSMITIVGESFLETAGLLKRVITPLSDSGISIYSFALGDKYVSLYVRAEDEAKSYQLLHDVVLSEKQLKSVTVTSDIAMFMVASRMFIDTPGIIQRLTLPLSEKNINIIEMVTIKTDIFIFVNWEDREQVYRLLSKEMERIRKDGTVSK